MELRKIILKITVVVLGTFLPSAVLFAQNISVAQDTTINLTGIGRNFTLLSTTNALDQLQINDAGTAFTITTNLSTGTVRINSAEGVNIGGANNTSNIALTTCDSTGSLLVIQANTSAALTVTITPPTTGAVICSTSAPQASTGSGGSSPAPSPSPSVSPTSPPAVEEPLEKPPEELSFKDVKPADEKFVIPLAELMLAQKTYAVPRSKRFGVKVATRGDFGLQIAAAVAELGCGSDEKFPGTKKCRYNAVKAGLIKRNFPRRALKKWEFLELLLKSRGIGLVNAQKTDLKKECPDVKRPTKRMAGVYFAAKLAGLPVKTGSKCRLKSTFSRKEAAKLGFAAMSVK